MKIAVGNDHAGFPLRDTVIEAIKEAGHEVLDFGTYSTESVDFSDFVEKVGRAVQKGEAQRGIAICGSGVGSAITVNKLRGVYGCVCHDTYSAHQGVEHDNMNVLCLGARVIGVEIAKEIVVSYIKAQYYNEGKYARRVGKIIKIETEELGK